MARHQPTLERARHRRTAHEGASILRAYRESVGSVSRGGLTMELESVARSLEVAGQLRAAVMEGDEARIARLLSDLLRVRGLTRGQRVRLQLRVLLNLVHSLRSAMLNDELTGLYNRRGFMQLGARLLDLSARDEHAAYLIHFRLQPPATPNSDSAAPSASAVVARQMGNFMRDLFPSYGVYEVLGRLSTFEFAALTPVAEHATRSALMLQARSRCELTALPLEAGIARSDPACPVPIDELLQTAAGAAGGHETLRRLASSGSAPQPGVTLCCSRGG
jgi:GGDEF domain-containing protein